MDDEVYILEKLRLVEKENEVLKQILTDNLSEKDKLYIKIKYGIEW